MTTEPPPTIEYARDRRPGRRTIRRGIILVASISAAFLAWQLGPRMVYQSRLYYWQQQCLAFDCSGTPLLSHPSDPRPQVPTPWLQFNAIFRLRSKASGDTLLLHEMRTKDGEPRLVHIEVERLPNQPEMIGCSATVLEPGTLFRPPRFLSGGFEAIDGVGSLTLYGASVDPNDRNHFTFLATGSGVERSFDGRIAGDAVVIHPREE